jgi:preprotein translocase subunit SecG
MYTVLIVLIIITAILLMLVVLAQNPKGGGLSSQFGGSGTTQLMGVKKTGDFLEKATWFLAVSLIALTLVANVIAPTATNQGISTPNLDSAGQPQQSLPINQDAQSSDAIEGLSDTTSAE